jgi:hypothetical protein
MKTLLLPPLFFGEVVDVSPHPNSEINSKLEKGSTRGREPLTPAEGGVPESAGERIEEIEITKETLERLLEKAEDAETRYLLFLTTNNRPGPSFTDVATYQVVLGEVIEIELDRVYNYPHCDSRRYLIIPKTIPVVIDYYHKWDFGSDQGEKEIVYIFTKDGWKRVEVK